MTNNNKILITSIIAITVLFIGLLNTAFAEHNPNHNPGGNRNSGANVQATLDDLQDQIVALQIQDGIFQGLIIDLQAQVNSLTTAVTDGLAALSTALIAETNVRIMSDESLQTQIEDSAGTTSWLALTDVPIGICR